MKGNIKDIGFLNIPLNSIKRNPHQPRKIFDESKLRELADNIKQNGLLQPIVVRRIKENEYIIIAGERRYRAHKLLGLPSVKARVIECDDKTAYELTLLENLQREDLNIIEEAKGYEYLKSKFGYSLDELSKVTGKSPSNISNILSILKEDQEIQKYVLDKTLTLAAYVWIKQLPNKKEKLKLLQLLREEKVKRTKVKDYVRRVLEAYKYAEKLGLRPEDVLNQIERKGKPGRYDIKEDIIPEDFNFYFIVDFSITARDLRYLPSRRILISAYHFLYDKSSAKRLTLILLDKAKVDALFCDSGVMPACRKKDWSYFDKVETVLEFYELAKPDICVSCDVPFYPFVFNNWHISKDEMWKITERNAKKFLSWKPKFKTTKVFPLQGDSPESYLECFYRYKKLGVFDEPDTTFGFGGLATSSQSHQVAVVSHVMKDSEVQKVRKRVPFVHGFGIGNPQRILSLYKLGVNSFDALTICVLMATGQYWLRNGKTAIHIIHESPLAREVRLHFNALSFWGQLTELFAKERGIQLTQTTEKRFDLSNLEGGEFDGSEA